MQRTYPEPDPESQGEPPRALPPELLVLNHQNRLRAIGRHLDVEGFRNFVILEVEGGFIVRAVDRSDRGVDLLEFSDASYPERMIQATESRGTGERRNRASPIAPTGYEDLLRAIGRQADLRHLGRLTIVEMSDGLAVAGDDFSTATAAAPFDARLNMDMISQILDEAFRQRGHGGQGSG